MDCGIQEKIWNLMDVMKPVYLKDIIPGFVNEIKDMLMRWIKDL